MNQNNNILMYGWELPPNNTGGLGVACYGLAKGLSEIGYSISFALPRRLKANIPFMKIIKPSLLNVNITAFNATILPYFNTTKYQHYLQSLPPAQLRLYGNSLYDEAQRFGHITSNWSQKQPHSLIHAHDWMTYPAGITTSKVNKKPWVAHIHATEFDRSGGQIDERIAEIEYQGLNRADHVIAVSNYTKDIVTRRYSVPADRITVIHNGIDLNDFSTLNLKRIFPNDHIVLFVGRLTLQKGVDYFLQSAKNVLSRRPNTIFIIAGSGDLEQKLILESAHLGIGDRVIFAGFQAGQRLNSLYQMADVFVMPSVSEPYGIVALEAIASGTPTIISKQSGVSETIQNVHKVDFWDINKITDTIIHTLDFPQISKQMAVLARTEAKQMTWRNAALKISQIYDHLS